MATALGIVLTPREAAANASSIVVLPSTGIVAGSTVGVAGTGFPPNQLVGIAQCLSDATNETGCDLTNLRLLNSDASGAISGSFTTRNPMLINGSPIDCNHDSRGCMVGAGAALDIQGTFATAPITFAPEVAPLAGTSKLANNPIVVGMSTAVAGTGWSPYATLEFELCEGDGSDVSKCTNNDAFALDGSGALDYWLYVEETIYYPDGSSFICSSAPSACSLVTFDRRDRASTKTVEFLDYEQPQNGTLTITSAMPINDGDPFTVVGSGWQPNTYVIVNLCATASFCIGASDSVISDAAGNFTFDLTFPQWIDSQHACDSYGVVCSLHWAHELLYDATANAIPVHYTPLATPVAGSVYAPPTAVELTYPNVDVGGWAPRSYVEAALCEANNPNGAAANCFYPATVAIDASGNASFQVFVDQTILASGIDCSVAGACHIAVWDGRDKSIVATSPIQVLARRTGSITVTPNTALHDGDQVTITGTGWTPTSYYEIRQCLTVDAAECLPQRTFAYTDDFGDFFVTPIVSDTVPQLAGGWYTDCAASVGTCSYIVRDYSTSRQLATQSLNFAAATDTIMSNYTDAEAVALHSAALQLGLTDDEFQRTAAWATMYVLGVAGAPSVSPVVNTGTNAISTNYPSVEYRVVHGVATRYGRTDGEFQKLSAMALAFVLGFS